MFGNSRLFDDSTLYPYKLQHLWQSRAFGDTFLLNYILQGADAVSMKGAFLKEFNYFEDQAYGGLWW